MTVVLPSAVRDSLRFADNYRRHRDYLMQLDRVRFRALGEANLRAFVREGVTLADHVGAEYVEEAQYILFVMSGAGTHFMSDPRLGPFAEALTGPPVPGLSRTEALHRAVSEFALEFVGRDFALYAGALEAFSRMAGPAMRAADPVAACLEAVCRAYGFIPDLPRRLPARMMAERAAASAAALGLAGPQATALCLGLGFWLGTGFDRDPLYPWVRAKVDGAGPSPAARLAALEAYTARRLGRQLRHLKERTGVRL
ncbi:MAG: hypothetical protein MUE98_09210 [Rhodobacteraceae bacterium]|jgi:hypothetical protein|nr:hypothetical protein [Paracoccaceae bacterium]